MDLRSFQRAAETTDAEAPLATAQLVFTTGAPVRRYDWARDRMYLEVLVVEEGALRLARLQRGAPLLNSHRSYDLEAQMGVCENPVIASGAGTVDVTFSRRPSVAGYVQDVGDGIIRNVSVGYVRHVIEMHPPVVDGGTWEYRVTDWEPYEVSLTPIPADMDSQVVRSALPSPEGAEQALDMRMFPCEFIEVRATPNLTPSPMAQQGSHSKEMTMTPEEIAAQEAQRAAAQQAQQDAAVAAANQRAADITDLCARHNVPQLAAGLVRGNQTLDQARTAVLQELAVRDAAGGGHRNVGTISTVSDETETRMAGMLESISHRVDPRTELTDNGRRFRSMSLLEVGRRHLEAAGINTDAMSRMQLAGSMLQHRSPGMHSTSDFANLFSNIANKRLRNGYQQAAATYGMWARQAPNAPDFKSMSIVSMSGAPELLQTNEHGEFKYGTMSDGAENYGLLTYGRIVSLTRQMIVNDDLRAFDRMVGAFGDSARRLENRVVYAQLTANANMADGTTLFHGNRGNLATGAGSALQESALVTARAAMRSQKGMQSEVLNIAPAYLIVPNALESTAYKLTSAAYVPAKQSDVSEFRSGGRTALEPIVETLLDATSATAYYLAANNGQVDTVEYCYLDGDSGPVIETQNGFEVDGVSYKCRLDFAAKATDFRGLYKAAGA